MRVRLTSRQTGIVACWSLFLALTGWAAATGDQTDVMRPAQPRVGIPPQALAGVQQIEAYRWRAAPKSSVEDLTAELRRAQRLLEVAEKDPAAEKFEEHEAQARRLEILWVAFAQTSLAQKQPDAVRTAEGKIARITGSFRELSSPEATKETRRRVASELSQFMSQNTRGARKELLAEFLPTVVFTLPVERESTEAHE